MAYTDRQIELIRVRLKAYYDLQSLGPRRATWGGLCDEIFDLTNVQMDDEVLRQFAKRVIRKNREQRRRAGTLPERPRLPSAENLNAIISFLCHEDVGVLSPDELRDPQVPYQAIRLLFDFFEGVIHHQIPSGLSGVYESWSKIEGTDEFDVIWLRARLTLDVELRNPVVHASDKTEVYTLSPENGWELNGTKEGKGWGILIPGNNILIFIQDRFTKSHYSYLTIAINAAIVTYREIVNLALLRHERPIDCDPGSKTIEQLISETDGGTFLLNFRKLRSQ